MPATLTATGTGLPVTANLIAYHGDSWSQTFRLLQGDQPVDLTNIAVSSRCKGTDGQTHDLPTWIDDPAGGVFHIEIPPEAGPDLYRYDIEMVDAGAVTTWINGRLQIKADVT